MVLFVHYSTLKTGYFYVFFMCKNGPIAEDINFKTNQVIVSIFEVIIFSSKGQCVLFSQCKCLIFRIIVCKNDNRLNFILSM